MECSAPDRFYRRTYNLPRPLEHFLRRLVRERQKKDSFGGHPLFDQIRDAVDERAGFTRSGGGQNEHGAVARCRGGALLWVEKFRKICHFLTILDF